MSALSETSVFASIPEAIDEIRQGRMVIVVDGADRENEGDLIMAAERHARGDRVHRPPHERGDLHARDR